MVEKPPEVPEIETRRPYKPQPHLALVRQNGERPVNRIRLPRFSVYAVFPRSYNQSEIGMPKYFVRFEYPLRVRPST